MTAAEQEHPPGGSRLLYSVTEAASLLGVGRTYMFRLIATGERSRATRSAGTSTGSARARPRPGPGTRHDARPVSEPTFRICALHEHCTRSLLRARSRRFLLLHGRSGD
jgi:excisionase family DNA binding protein